MKRCVIIDDEPLGIKLLTSYIERIDELALLGSFSNPLEGLSFINNKVVDLFFLDIQMPELNGLDLARTLGTDIPVILTTAYPEYAVDGFEISALDYLVKPISFERFVKAVSKASVSSQRAIGRNSFLLVKTEYRHHKVDHDDIFYIRGMGDYTAIFTEKERVMTLENMKSLEERLPRENFMRVHKSFIISLLKIQYVEKNRIKVSDQLIPIGATYQNRFWEKMNAR